MDDGVRGSRLVFWGRALGPSSVPWGGVFRGPLVTSGCLPLYREKLVLRVCLGPR